MVQTNFKTYELAVELYQECAALKAKGVMRDQLERASLSVVLNLAEGAGKPKRPDKKRFYAMAYGSVRECQAILRLMNAACAFAKADAVGAAAYKLMKSMS